MANNGGSNITNEIFEMIVAHLQVGNAINALLPSVMGDSSSSDEDDSMPRPMFTREYTGHQYVDDVLAGHPVRSYNCFRMPAEAFKQLRDLLVARGLLTDTKNMVAAEQLGIFLRGIAHAHTYRQLCEFFQHSLETVSRYFNVVLQAIVSLSDEFINSPRAEAACHPYISGNPEFYPFFRDAIGAIDGTHVPALVERDMQNRYRNRKGFTSQNVMAAVSFDRQFVYIASGWEGSASDMRVLRWAVEEGDFRVPQGKYYLVDYEYANTDKLMAPFRGYQYHLSEYQGSTTHRYSVAQELYNHRHAMLRNTIERTFDIWKERFRVLTHMRQFPMAVQADIVLACAVLHNFVGRYHEHDIYFNMSQTEMQHDRQFGEVQVDDDDDDPNVHATVGERVQGDAVRHGIATNLWDARAMAQRRNSI